MAATDKESIGNLIWLSKFGFSLEDLSQYFKISVNEVIDELAQTLNIHPRRVKSIMMCKERDFSLQEISELFEIDIAILKKFLRDGKCSVEVSQQIRRCLADDSSKQDFISILANIPEVREELSDFNEDHQRAGSKLTKHELAEDEPRTTKMNEELIKKQLVIAKVLATEGTIYYSDESTGKSQELFMKCQHICQELPPSLELAKIYKSLGNSYLSMDSEDRAEVLLMKSLHICRELPPNFDLAKIFGELARSYSSIDSDVADEIVMECLDLCQTLPPNLGLAKIYESLGDNLRWRDNEMAEEMFMKCLHICRELPPNIDLAKLYVKLGNGYYRFESHSKAVDMFMRCQEILEELPHNLNLAKIYQKLGKEFKRMHSNDKAEEMLMKSQRIREEIISSTSREMETSVVNSVELSGV